MRRRIRKDYIWANGITNWIQTAEVHYIYDGNLVIQERDANNLPTVSYTRGTDLSGSFQGAGGLGGLLARSQFQATAPQLVSPHAYYHCDGNGNITALINSLQLLVAKYEYDPYGNITSLSGPLADANVYRFSSKEFDKHFGLIYYLYRFYDPYLQRWLNRDPVEEFGGINLYGFVANNPINDFDPWGQCDCAALASQLAYAKSVLARFQRYFQPGGIYATLPPIYTPYKCQSSLLTHGIHPAIPCLLCGFALKQGTVRTWKPPISVCHC
jgi:RHS repeat-associated protein